ncbi:MAG: DUF4199 domain-containing protein [Ginsengibacter sp.]|jgi:hypothetical protein
METTVTTPATKGIVLGLILVVLALASYFLDLEANKPLQYTSYIIFLGGIIGSVVLYGKQIDNQSTFGNYFAHGFKVSAIVTAIMVVYILILIFLFPDFKEKALEISHKAMVDRNMKQEDIDMGMEWTKKLFVPILLATTVFGYLFFGVVASLLGAAFTKKNPVHHFDNLEQNN